MVQEIRIGEYTFESTTDSKTIKVSDDKFAEMTLLKEVLEAIGRKL